MSVYWHSYMHPCTCWTSARKLLCCTLFRQETLYYIDWCRQSFGLRGLVNFYLSDDGLPLVHLTHPNGSTATIHLHGANVTSWTNPGGQELLHLREQGPDEPIR